jgi:membrane protein insertase Oxa1/YidC/SpoIIIJ
MEMKLLQPDNDEVMAAMKRHQQQGNREAIKMEKAKLKRLRKSNGIYPSISVLNILQLPLHMVYISLINKLSYNFNISPEMLTEGFFWFKDLSSPDPLGLLPVIGGAVNILNMLNTTTTNSSTVMRKMRKYIVILPIMTIPVWMTFPVVSTDTASLARAQPLRLSEGDDHLLG